MKLLFETCTDCGRNDHPIVLWGDGDLVCGACATAPLPDPTPEEIAEDAMETADRLMGGGA